MLLMETVQGPHLSGTLWRPESGQRSSPCLFSSSGTMTEISAVLMCSYTEVTWLWLLAGVVMMVLRTATPKLLLFP